MSDVDVIVEFDQTRGYGVLRTAGNSPSGNLNLASRELRYYGSVVCPQIESDQTLVEVPWLNFLRLSNAFMYVIKEHQLSYAYSDEALRRLRAWRSDQEIALVTAPSTDDFAEIERSLAGSGWDLSKRRLTARQLESTFHLSKLHHGANFSVPGAGKTTVALAVNLITRSPTTRLLVVAPRNAFNAWDEALNDCLSGPVSSFCRLEGGRYAIEQYLRGNYYRYIINYQQLLTVEDSLRSFMLGNKVHLILDESHRIKSGERGRQGSAALQIGVFANRRDILSGTPMPQSFDDLVPQFDFLYPASTLSTRLAQSPTSASSMIRGGYVRTRYSELGLPKTLVPPITPVEMSESQLALYSLLRDQFLKQVAQVRSPQISRTSVMRILQCAIDPQEAAISILRDSAVLEPVDSALCQRVLEDGLGPRLVYGVNLARETVKSGKKVVIWAPFTGTIERLRTELDDLGAEIIFGETPTGSPAEFGTRENIIRRFHESSTLQVLIANPMAGGEGISLHRVCQTAIYVGRTYNATHYLQSRDRINRIGLPPDTTPTVYIIESLAPRRIGSIDLSVRNRLDQKIDAMGRALDDPDLTAISLESSEFDPTLEDDFTLEDLQDLISQLRGS